MRPLGIVDDAIGTAIPLLCTATFFLPRPLSRLLDVALEKFIPEAYFYPAMFCIPMALTLAFTQRFVYAHRYPQLVLSLLLGWIVYGGGVLWFVFTREPAAAPLKAQLKVKTNAPLCPGARALRQNNHARTCILRPFSSGKCFPLCASICTRITRRCLARPDQQTFAFILIKLQYNG